MPDYVRPPDRWEETEVGRIACFEVTDDDNLDADTVRSFGEEWTKFDRFDDAEIRRIGDEYFDLVDETMLGPDSTVLDLGCGTGRWTRYLAERVGTIEAVDPSDAVFAARRMTAEFSNVRVTRASLDGLPFHDGAFDFVVCLGALHHMPDTAAALERAVRALRPGGWILLYLYYALDDRGPLYRGLFRAADLLRRGVSRLPGQPKRAVSDAIAGLVYLPLVGAARGVGAVFGESLASRMPLHYYADKSWRVIRNDALDRFGTPLEQRFTISRIRSMMADAGLRDIRFSENAPYWHAVGRRSER